MNLLQIKKLYSFIVPSKVRKVLGEFHLIDHIILKKRTLLYKKTILRLQNKNEWNVVFFAMDISFWKYDSLFRLMQNHPQFHPVIFLAPSLQLLPETKEKVVSTMRDAFISRGYEIINSISNFPPDIIFYTQPYRNSIQEHLTFYNFPNALPCYIPYAFWMSYYRWGYDMPLHNYAWMLFYPTIIHKQNAEKLAFNKGENISITGYPTADDFLEKKIITSPWHPDDKIKVIWAPHHSIFAKDLSDCASFLEYASFMQKIAKKYKESIQIAFKPHPLLKNKLYQHPNWGIEKTERYFDFWKEGNNTILSEGDYIDLFLSSDALIHDCGSFTIEYLYTKKAVMYNGNPRDSILCPFGKLATEAHYTNKEMGVEDFIKNVVIEKNDEKKNLREHFFEKYLLPPNNQTVSQNILNAILSGIKKT
ncbi:MAG: hypothetical protein GX638_13320 [Crenarchaeota archaeon]|nr:hypothetical protein [Thermoproteota archaeon]